MQELTVNQIHCGDNRYLFQKLKDNSIGFIVTSPPYWDAIKYDKWGLNIGRKQPLEKYLLELKSVLTECYRVLKPNRYVFVVIRDITKNRHTYLLHAKISDIAEKVGFILEDIKLILLLDHSMYDFGLLLRKGATNNSGILVDKYDVPVWDFRKKYNKKLHPAEFVEEIPRVAISKWCKDDEIVLDPFFGRGTTAVAARTLNRNWIGFELSPKYVKMAKERLTKQKPLERFCFSKV